jgi:cold shock CspA family protein
MTIPITIAWEHFQKSEAIEQAVQKHAEKLEQFCPRIVACHVAIEAPHHHHHQGNVYNVRIQLTVPGDVIVIDKESHKQHKHEDVYVAIRDAFDAARRRLEDYVRRQRQDIKHHESWPEGQIVRLMSDEDYGFIGTDDGREVYFNANSLLHAAFKTLEIGTRVCFVEELGEKGPQASSVRVVGRPRSEPVSQRVAGS